MEILKKLRHIYKCDSLGELAKLLGVPPRTIYGWNSGGSTHGSTQGLLEIIYEQKKQIVKMEEEWNSKH